MNEPFHECPSFQRCSVNQCPLDEQMLSRKILTADRGQKCGAHRSIREAIAAKYPDLPTGGLTLKEVVRDERRRKAKERWDAMTPEARKLHLEKLRPFQPRTDGGSAA